jgi:hypothetical protein
MSRAKNRWALIVSTTAGLFAAAYADAAIATADLSSPGNLCADVAQLASVVGPGVEQSLPGAASALADSPAGPILGAGLAGAAGAVPTRDALLSPTGLAALPTSPITSLAPAAAPITQEAGVVGPAAVGGTPAGGRAPMAGSPLESLPMLADSPLPLLGGMPLADLLCCP